MTRFIQYPGLGDPTILREVWDDRWSNRNDIGAMVMLWLCYGHYGYAMVMLWLCYGYAMVMMSLMILMSDVWFSFTPELIAGIGWKKNTI